MKQIPLKENSMTQIFVILAFVVTAMTSTLAIKSVHRSSAYSATPSSVPDVVSSWAKDLNKPLVWEAGSGYDGRMVQFEDIGTINAGNVNQAFSGLSRVLEKAGLARLQVCIFSNVMVVRRVTQPDCGQAIE